MNIHPFTFEYEQKWWRDLNSGIDDWFDWSNRSYAFLYRFHDVHFDIVKFTANHIYLINHPIYWLPCNNNKRFVALHWNYLIYRRILTFPDYYLFCILVHSDRSKLRELGNVSLQLTVQSNIWNIARLKRENLEDTLNASLQLGTSMRKNNSNFWVSQSI